MLRRPSNAETHRLPSEAGGSSPREFAFNLSKISLKPPKQVRSK